MIPRDTRRKTVMRKSLRGFFAFLLSFIIIGILLTPQAVHFGIFQNLIGSTYFQDTRPQVAAPLCEILTSWEQEAAVNCDVPSRRMFDVVLVSPGGVGSSALFSSMATNVSEKLNNLDDLDGLKHRLYHTTIENLSTMIKNNTNFTCATRMFVYTFADAASSVFSLFRREFHEEHNIKLNDRAFPRNCFPGDVFTYAEKGIDYLNLEPHLYSWIHGGICSSRIPVLFLRSEGRNISQVWETLRLFLAYPSQRIQPDILKLRISESHYATDEEYSEAYVKMQMGLARFQSYLDSLGYLSVAFQGTFKRLI